MDREKGLAARGRIQHQPPPEGKAQRIKTPQAFVEQQADAGRALDCARDIHAEADKGQAVALEQRPLEGGAAFPRVKHLG